MKLFDVTVTLTITAEDRADALHLAERAMRSGVDDAEAVEGFDVQSATETGDEDE